MVRDRAAEFSEAVIFVRVQLWFELEELCGNDSQPRSIWAENSVIALGFSGHSADGFHQASRIHLDLVLVDSSSTTPFAVVIGGEAS